MSAHHDGGYDDGRYGLEGTVAQEHLRALGGALGDFAAHAWVLEVWAQRLATVLDAGGRLLACGNGGSAAEAQHLTAELVGRFQAERRPYSAIALHADTSAATAIGNDYGPDEVYARQVRAHGRPGDVLVCLSTSGRSGNVLAAARTARESGLTVWGLTGPAPNPLVALCDDAVPVPAPDPATVQELHLAAVHMLCGALDSELAAAAVAREER